MNKLKKIGASLIALAAIDCQAAQEYTLKMGVNEIHFAHISISHSAMVNLSTSVGNIQQGKCIYEKDTTPHAYPLHDGITVTLNGDILKELVGINYNCAATNYEYGGQVVRDEFKLIKEVIGSEEVYKSTEPREVIVKLPF